MLSVCSIAKGKVGYFSRRYCSYIDGRKPILSKVYIGINKDFGCVLQHFGTEPKISVLFTLCHVKM